MVDVGMNVPGFDACPSRVVPGYANDGATLDR